jgi:hypothetical protein
VFILFRQIILTNLQEWAKTSHQESGDAATQRSLATGATKVEKLGVHIPVRIDKFCHLSTVGFLAQVAHQLGKCLKHVVGEVVVGLTCILTMKAHSYCNCMQQNFAATHQNCTIFAAHVIAA